VDSAESLGTSPLVAYHDGTVIIGSAKGRMVGSIDRPVRPDQPDPPDRPDRSERPKTPQDFDAKLAERLSTLTRASAYERLYARAQAQDAPFRERLAREESAQPKESLSADKPEPDLERPRTYWTEVPRLLANWDNHVDKWPRPLSHSGSADQSDIDTRVGSAVERIPRAEPLISKDIKETAELCSQHTWLGGFEFRLKGTGRIVEKVFEKLDAEPDRNPDEVVQQIPDAIRYTCCIETGDYTSGFAEAKKGLEGRGYEMYYSRNYWSNPEYRGINTRWMTPEGQRFEVQFHTAESFHSKHAVTHKAYERIRDPVTSERERLELRDFQRDVSYWIPVPERVDRIQDYTKEGSLCQIRLRTMP
jgi:hypothetical protein